MMTLDTLIRYYKLVFLVGCSYYGYKYTFKLIKRISEGR